MANSSKPGHKGKVTIGANKILGMGVWHLDGLTRAQLDDTEFGDDYTRVKFGLITSGGFTFSGNYKKDDTQGQDILAAALISNSDIADIRFYVDSVSYFTPNSTTAAGGGLPAESPVSHVNISERAIDFDMTALGKTNFAGTITGVWRLI